MLDNTLGTVRRLIPASVFSVLRPIYHWKLALLAAVWYRFPSRKIKVIAVTGTKGKSSTVEILNAILEEAGYKTALSNTIRYKIGNDSHKNLFKMSMPGRFFAQRLMRQAVNENCQYMIMEMTSQGSLLYRHRFIELDTLIFTNLSPEHIEAHGSYDRYRDSKLAIAKNMSRSRKPVKAIIANADDKESAFFLECPAERKISYSLTDIEPYTVMDEGLEFTLEGKPVRSSLSGLFNLYNILAAITAAKNEDVPTDKIIKAVENLSMIPGRVQKVSVNSSQEFEVIVDYAHTADSLQKLYETFKSKRIIAVLGGTGGGRDTWKRSEMGKLADKYCAEIILTNEDPYDENPDKIVSDVAAGITAHKPLIIMDRRQAIRAAIKKAQRGDVILITGKGTDPYIMGPKGSKIVWSDAEVAAEELRLVFK